jgi:hypothetical protein
MISNTEVAGLVLMAHTDELRCPGCLTPLMIVLGGAVVNSQWTLLVAPEPSRIINPQAMRVPGLN